MGDQSLLVMSVFAKWALQYEHRKNYLDMCSKMLTHQEWKIFDRLDGLLDTNQHLDRFLSAAAVANGYVNYWDEETKEYFRKMKVVIDDDYLQEEARIMKTQQYQTQEKLLASTGVEREEIEKQLENAKSVCESRAKVERIYSELNPNGDIYY